MPKIENTARNTKENREKIIKSRLVGAPFEQKSKRPGVSAVTLSRCIRQGFVSDSVRIAELKIGHMTEPIHMIRVYKDGVGIELPANVDTRRFLSMLGW